MYRMFQIFDKVSGITIGPIMVEHGAASAIRHFHDALQDPRSMLCKHPADFELLDLGEQLVDGTILAAEERWFVHEGKQGLGAGPAIRKMVVATGEAWVASREPSEQVKGVTGA